MPELSEIKIGQKVLLKSHQQSGFWFYHHTIARVTYVCYEKNRIRIDLLYFDGAEGSVMYTDYIEKIIPLVCPDYLKI